MLKRLVAMAAMLGALTGAAASAPDAGLDNYERRTVIERLSAALRDRYIYFATGVAAANRLDANLAAGAYDGITDRSALAARLTEDVRAVLLDLHFSVAVDGAPPPSRVGAVPSAEAGVVRADRLDGGLGYLQVVGFPEPALFKPALDRAMRALVGSKALIIDVRQNFGGDPNGVAYLASYLMPPGKRVHLNTFVSREPFSVDYKREDFFSSWTPVRFATQPVYVLVSKRTVSGGEEFAYDMQALIRGTLIGEITAGAANPTGPVPLGEDMTASIPWGRAENPITLSNWEHKGVEPDVVVPADDALGVVFARFGLPPARDIDAVSRARLFAPRTAPTPGSETALRRLTQGIAVGNPPYWAMTPDYAAFVRQNLAQWRALSARMGRLRTLEFDAAGMWGGDIYLATFERGQQLVSIALAANGKIAGGEIIGPPTAAEAP